MSYGSKYRPVVISCVLGITLLMCGIFSSTSIAEDTERIGPQGILLRPVAQPEEIATPIPAELKKKEMAERLDKSNLLYSARVVSDSDPRMLETPERVKEFEGKVFSVAQEAPQIDFAIIPVKPLFFSASPVTSTTSNSNEPGPWANWSQAAFDPRTGRFYSSVGDHGKYGGHIYIVEYDPASKTVKCLPEINRVLGRSQSVFGDGKIHGWLDFYQSRHLSEPQLWYCTYWAKYTEPDPEDYATGYGGGHIMSCDVLTGNFVDYGIPLKNASWPYHRVDTQRGIMYAVGMFSEFLAWDINNQKTLWAGYLPDGMQWYVRAFLIDEETGMVYTSNMADSDTKGHMIKYDPHMNRFSTLECKMPADGAMMRAQTPQRGADGLFYAITVSGELFSFDPVSETITDKGLCWPGKERYTCAMQFSPGKRYIYYLPGAHGRGHNDGSPIIQYDTETGTKKVLAFMFPYYYEKYGYTPAGTFSIKLDDAGENLFICWNGSFVDSPEDSSADVFGQCSVMLVHIPESERRE